MNILVTGGTGFIGSNLALELEKKDYSVIIIDNNSSGTEENIKCQKFSRKISEHAQEPRFLTEFNGEFINLDVSKPFKLKQKFDAIFHIAAITDPRFSDDNEMIRQNVDGFKNIIALAKKNNSKLIYASTANLYGNGKVPMKENQEKDIITAYGKSKLIMDETAEKLFDKMHIIGLRYFNVYGPREAHKGRPASMVYHLSNQIKSGKNPRIFKWGEQIRDHIYVKDCVRASMLALNAPSGIYNVGTGIGTSFNDLIKILNKILGTNYEPEYFDNPYKQYQANTQADTTKAKKELKFEAEYSLKEGIKDYMEWLEKNAD